MDKHALRVIITGSTGMVGEGVMDVCLRHPDIKEVLVINRRTGGVVHPKLKEILHQDFYDLAPIADQLNGYDACFFCLGVTSVGKKEPEYFKLTHTLTLHVAEVLALKNPNMCFCYVSGAGTDSSEQGKRMWARVKGKTENDLMKLPFKNVYALRPGFIKPIKGLKHTHSFYKYIGWMFPIGRKFFAGGFCTLGELGRCMIHLAQDGYEKPVIEGKDIIKLGQQ
jgi:hypothetical protein